MSVKSFVIDRKVWLRGEGHESSCLLRDADHKRCCVGIYLAACGVPDNALLERSAFCNLYNAPIKNAPEETLWLGDDLKLGNLYEINDFKGIDESEREKDIAEKFAQQGIEVTFVN